MKNNEMAVTAFGQRLLIHVTFAVDTLLVKNENWSIINMCVLSLLLLPYCIVDAEMAVVSDTRQATVNTLLTVS